MDVDLTNKIERSPEFEDRLGVVLDCFSAFLEKDHLKIRGEFRSKKSRSIRGNMEVAVVVYDAANRVIGSDFHYISDCDFCGLEIVDVFMKLPLAQVSKIKVYPKRD